MSPRALPQLMQYLDEALAAAAAEVCIAKNRRLPAGERESALRLCEGCLGVARIYIQLMRGTVRWSQPAPNWPQVFELISAIAMADAWLRRAMAPRQPADDRLRHLQRCEQWIQEADGAAAQACERERRRP